MPKEIPINHRFEIRVNAIITDLTKAERERARRAGERARLDARKQQEIRAVAWEQALREVEFERQQRAMRKEWRKYPELFIERSNGTLVRGPLWYDPEYDPGAVKRDARGLPITPARPSRALTKEELKRAQNRERARRARARKKMQEQQVKVETEERFMQEVHDRQWIEAQLVRLDPGLRDYAWSMAREVQEANPTMPREQVVKTILKQLRGAKA